MHTQLLGDLKYPVGYHMDTNKSKILYMMEVLRDTVGKDTPISLWCRGSSGAIIAAIISTGFDNCIINHVKKEGEESHSTHEFNTDRSRKHIIVDDFIRSGKTVNAIYLEMLRCSLSVDYLCVFECVYECNLKFIPKNVISERYVTR